MTRYARTKLPAPTDDRTFDSYCVKIWGRRINDLSFGKYGRNGQGQQGVDSYGYQNGNGDCWCVQAKATILSEEDISKEVKKAKEFLPLHKHYVITTTGERDAKLQEHVRKLNEASIAEGSFTITIKFWDDILEYFDEYPEIGNQYFNEHFSPTLLPQSEPELPTINIEKNKSVTVNIYQDSSGGKFSLEELEGEFNAELDQVREKIRAFKPSEAKELLDNFKARNYARSSNEIKYRIEYYNASIFLQMGEEAVAAQKYIDATPLVPESQLALENEAVGYLLLGELDTAKKKAEHIIQKFPDSIKAYTVIVQAFDPTIRTKEIVKQVPKNLLENSEITYALAGAFNRRGDFDEAEKWARKSLVKDKGVEASALLAEILLRRVLVEFPKIALHTLGETNLKVISEVEQLFDRAVKGVEDNILVAKKANHLINRSVALRLLGRTNEALECLEKVLEVDPENREALKRKALALFETGMPKEAAEAIESQLPAPESPETYLLLSTIYISLKELDKAASTLKKLPEEGLDSHATLLKKAGDA
jgi:tetratricopeptide (TPR) repeat protein